MLYACEYRLAQDALKGVADAMVDALWGRRRLTKSRVAILQGMLCQGADARLAQYSMTAVRAARTFTACMTGRRREWVELLFHRYKEEGPPMRRRGLVCTVFRVFEALG